MTGSDKLLLQALDEAYAAASTQSVRTPMLVAYVRGIARQQARERKDRLGGRSETEEL